MYVVLGRETHGGGENDPPGDEAAGAPVGGLPVDQLRHPRVLPQVDLLRPKHLLHTRALAAGRRFTHCSHCVDD